MSQIGNPKKWVDQGKEIYNQYVKALPFEIYSTLKDGKAVIVERFNRTLKQMMFKKFTFQGYQKWLKIVLEFWIPNIQPLLEIEAATTKRLNSNRDIAVNLLKRNTFTNTIIEQEKTWHIVSICNTLRFLFVTFKPTNLNQAFDINNCLFPSFKQLDDGVTIAVQILSLQVKLNQSRCPLDSVTLNPQNFNVFEAYIMYESVCKVLGVKLPLNPNNFGNLYI